MGSRAVAFGVVVPEHGEAEPSRKSSWKQACRPSSRRQTVSFLLHHRPTDGDDHRRRHIPGKDHRRHRRRRGMAERIRPKHSTSRARTLHGSARRDHAQGVGDFGESARTRSPSPVTAMRWQHANVLLKRSAVDGMAGDMVSTPRYIAGTPGHAQARVRCPGNDHCRQFVTGHRRRIGRIAHERKTRTTGGPGALGVH